MSNAFSRTTIPFRVCDDELSFELDVVQDLCIAIDSPRSLAVYLMVKYKCWNDLVSLPLPFDTENASNFADDYLVSTIMKKSPNLPLDVDRRDEAVKSFYTAESLCRVTNERLYPSSDPRIHRVSREIDKILGVLTSSDLNSIWEGFGFGPGSTTSVSGRKVVGPQKYEGQFHLTLELLPFARSCLGTIADSVDFTVVEGNKFTTVPKNAKTDRGICVEPDLNIFVQKGIGACIRDRLKRSGIDLRYQDSNRSLASRARRDGLATIDLSMASDTLSTSAVFKLIPDRWFHLLELPRSSSTYVDGKLVPLEKWSSMGNGYTFELETLVFWSIVKSVVPSSRLNDCSVYGDDIIVPQCYSEDVIDTLNFFGFKVNEDKSYLSGNFFESCGSDFYCDVEVRPFYLRGSKGHIPYALQVANRLSEYSLKRGLFDQSDERFHSIWLSLMKFVPHRWRLPVPPTLGDSGIICGEKTSRSPYGLEGWVVPHIPIKTRTWQSFSIGVVHARLSNSSSGGNRFPLRGIFGKPRTKRTNISYWPEGLFRLESV